MHSFIRYKRSLITAGFLLFMIILLSVAAAQEVDQESGKSIIKGILIGFVAGFLVSLTPCVWPMYPIVSSVIVNSAHVKTKKSALVMSLLYVLGLAIVYVILGAITGALGEVAFNYLKNVWVITFIAAILIIFGLSMIGLFDIKMPASLSSRLASSPRKGKWGILIMGAVSGIVLSPCVTPAIVGMMAFAVQSGSAFTGAITLLGFAVGMGTILVVIGTVSGAIKVLPKPGPWMNWIKRGLGVAMIVLAVYIALPFWASALQEEEPVEVAEQVPPISEIAEEEGISEPDAEPEEINWLTNLEKGLEMAENQDKPVMIDFTADWCTACKELEKKTFSREPVIKESERFVMIRFDATSPNADERQALKEFKVFGFPTLVLISSDGEREQVVGFVDAETLLESMKKVD